MTKPAKNAPLRKLVVSHRAALRKKYGARGLRDLDAALARMIAADARRGVATVVEYLDTARALGRTHAPAGNAAASKRAVDRLFTHHGSPDYLLLLGAQDVIPHQRLANVLPVGTGEDEDPDAIVWSDLPYACAAKASTRIKDFVGPTRAVGRLPDVPGGDDVSVLVHRIDAAASAKPHARLGKRFALSAAVWQGASREVLRRAFGRASALRVSPPRNAPVPKAALAAPLHLINCHGAPSDPTFYGDDDHSMPEALRSTDARARVTAGTVAAAECCYGAELYAPAGVDPGISSTYLDAGAIGFLGSTTVSYGAFDAGLENADVVCARFLELVGQGASLGRALLEARLHFVQSVQPLSGIELKTMAQFLLLGDPSLRAVVPQPARRNGAQKSAPAAAGAASVARHHRHRSVLTRAGTAMRKWADDCRLSVHAVAPAGVARAAARAAAAGDALGVPAHAASTYQWTHEGAPASAADVAIVTLSAEHAPTAEAMTVRQIERRSPRGKVNVKAMAVAAVAPPSGPRRVRAVVTRVHAGKVVAVVRLAGR